jgi:hypothetical protein
VRNSKARKAVERKRKLTNRRRRIQYRLRERNWSEQAEPMFIADCRFVNPQSSIVNSYQ